MRGEFTRGLITGAIIGTTLSMIMPNRTGSRMSKKAFRNGSKMLRRATNVVGDMIDMWS